MTWPWITNAALQAFQRTVGSWFESQVDGQLKRVAVRLKLVKRLDDNATALAWEAYVELVTRISIVPMPDDQGFDREALDSLYTLFGKLRAALVRAGPQSAARAADDSMPIGTSIAVVLNVVLRPFVAYWHPRLERHEATRPPNVSKWDHEQAWSEHGAFREQLATLRANLVRFAAALEEVLDLPALARLRDAAEPDAT